MERATSDVFLCKWSLGTRKNRIVVEVLVVLQDDAVVDVFGCTANQSSNLGDLATWQTVRVSC